MASDLSFVEFVVDQLDESCAVTYKKMFGEFGLYSDGKMFAVICDNQLFVKPTNGGREFIHPPPGKRRMRPSRCHSNTGTSIGSPCGPSGPAAIMACCQASTSNVSPTRSSR